MSDTTLDLSSLARAADLLEETDPFSPNAADNTPENDATLRIKPTTKTAALAASSSVYVGSDKVDKDGDEALRQERDALRAINDSLETTFNNLSTAKEKMQRFGTTVQTTHNLMNLYTRLLSQASHTQQLLLDGEWEQAADVARARDEEEAEQRRLAEEERATQAEQERLEKEERQREEARRIRGASYITSIAFPSHKVVNAENPSLAGVRGGTRGSTRARGSSAIGRGRPPPSAAVISTSATSDTGAGRGIPVGRASAQVTGVRGQRGLRSRGRGRPPD